MDYKKAQNYWKEKAAASVKMEAAALKEKIVEYMSALRFSISMPASAA